MNWTDSQLSAIEARNGSILVSAAAGSGKTAVLVERVMRRLQDGCNIDELLIVTFTNAAASQMREKIAAALEKRIAQSEGNRHLLRQKTLLPFAKICTIDALCSSLARENFQRLDIEPDFTVADDLKLLEMKNSAAQKATEEMYSAHEKSFEELTELLFKGRDDSTLTETVIKVDDIACSYPDPEKWIDSLSDIYDCEHFEGSIFEKLTKEHILKKIHICLDGVKSALEFIKTDAKVTEKYMPVLLSDKDIYEKIIALIMSGKRWDDIAEGIGLLLSGIQRAPVVRNAPYEKDYAYGIRTANKEIIKNLNPFIDFSLADFEEDIEYTRSIGEAFSRTLLLYRKYLFDLKKASNSYSFSDISSFAIKCLCDSEGNKTELAKSLSKKYKEILVDEFQDVNDMQNLLFSLLSKDESNLFFVGDSKQSIYKFRQAKPKIFIDMKRSRPVYRDGNYPAVINLDMNFRSRKGVTEWVNFLFERIMAADDSEIYYDDTEHLRAGAEYPEKTEPDTEIHIIEKSAEGFKSIEEEAYYIADYIKKEMSKGLTVKDGETQRKARYSDFCILLRSDGGRIGTIASILRQCSIPAVSATKGNFFEVPEVQIMLSLLKVIDNPLRDIPLLSVMMSPIFGFSADDLARIRINDRKSSLYMCVKKAAETDDRYIYFLNLIANMRLRAASLPVGELIRQLMDETGYLAIAGAMNSGDGRRANLLQLQRLADGFSNFGNSGLSGFLRFMEGIEERADKLEKAPVIKGEADAVKIMTIHKSKGLEFPVCILADCSHAYNAREYNNNNYIITPEFGMTTVRRDAARFAQYNTLPKALSAETGMLSDFNEELRILYVALTRAKERLVTLSTLSNASKKIKELSSRISVDGEIMGVSEASSYTELILMSALTHPDAHLLREVAGIEGLPIGECDTSIKVVISGISCDEDEPEDEKSDELLQADEDVLRRIDEKLRYRYPFEELSGVIAKHSASKIEDSGINREFFASSRPAFLNEGGMTPAQRGTAFHKFMQYADFANARESVKAEAERLEANGIFRESERECLDLLKLESFFSGEIGRRICESEKIYREYRFTVSRNVLLLYPELSQNSADEEVIIQGMVDCAFLEKGRLHIVDYKTDRASCEEIVKRYTSQLLIYASAMSECTGYEVGDILLYSFHNGETIKL